MRLSSLVLLLSSLFAQKIAAQVAPAPKDTIATRVQVQGADCALFPAAIRFAPSFEKRLAASGRFTPNLQQVAGIEEALPHLDLLKICTHPVEQNDTEFAAVFKKSLMYYRRQYYGFYNSQHEPFLFINFFDRDIGVEKYWLKKTIRVIDGGFSIWSVYYNLTNKTFYNFDHASSARF